MDIRVLESLIESDWNTPIVKQLIKENEKLKEEIRILKEVNKLAGICIDDLTNKKREEQDVNEYPNEGEIVSCIIKNCSSGYVTEVTLKYAVEDDCLWRFEDGSELSYDFDVIKWSRNVRCDRWK